MTDVGKAKRRLRSKAKPKARPAPKKSKTAPGDAPAGGADKAEHPAAAASAPFSTWEAGAHEVTVEELADGLLNILGEGLEALSKTRAATGSRLMPGIEAKAREAVSSTMGGVVNFCKKIDKVAGADKERGFVHEESRLCGKDDR